MGSGTHSLLPPGPRHSSPSPGRSRTPLWPPPCCTPPPRTPVPGGPAWPPRRLGRRGAAWAAGTAPPHAPATVQLQNEGCAVNLHPFGAGTSGIPGDHDALCVGCSGSMMPRAQSSGTRMPGCLGYPAPGCCAGVQAWSPTPGGGGFGGPHGTHCAKTQRPAGAAGAQCPGRRRARAVAAWRGPDQAAGSVRSEHPGG